MKKIRTLFIFICCLMQATALFAQQKFTVQGKIDRLTDSKNLYLGNYIIPIKSDGTFKFTGEVPEPGKVFLRTDSSHIYVLWLDEGDYVLDCSEYRNAPGKKVLFKASLKSGPTASKVYGEFERQVYSGFVEYFPKDGKSRGKDLQQKVVIKYMDSLFKRYPDLKSLPDLIASGYHFVGDAATKHYISMLTPDMQNNKAIERIKNDLNREDKIASEGVFEDFSMRTADGKDFKLSDLKNKKIILVDFWASSCGPCRADHPDFIKMYEKYADKGLEIVSVSLDNNTDAWLKAIKQDNINAWVNVSDLQGWQSELVKNYYLNYIPFRFMLDGNRKILKVYQGSQLPSENELITNLK